MRITESSFALWAAQRSEATAAAARERRIDGARQAQASIVARLNVLDTDHDGWIDEDDLPYDQLLALERARAAETADELPAPEAPAQAPAAAPARPEPPAPQVQITPPPPAPGGGHVDLLA